MHLNVNEAKVVCQDRALNRDKAFKKINNSIFRANYATLKKKSKNLVLLSRRPTKSSLIIFW